MYPDYLCLFFSSPSLFRCPVTHGPGSPGPHWASRPELSPATEAGSGEESPWSPPGGPCTPALPMEAGGGWSLLAASLSLSVPGPWRGKGAATCLPPYLWQYLFACVFVLLRKRIWDLPWCPTVAGVILARYKPLSYYVFKGFQKKYP